MLCNLKVFMISGVMIFILAVSSFGQAPPVITLNSPADGDSTTEYNMSLGTTISGESPLTVWIYGDTGSSATDLLFVKENVTDPETINYTWSASVFEPESPYTMALWHFDDNTGTAVSDESGHGNDGILVNGPVWTAEGQFGYALDLDGANDYMVIPDDTSLDVNPTGGAITMEAWIYPHGYTSLYNTIVAKRGWHGGVTNYQMSIDSASETMMYYSSTTGGVKTSTMDIPLNEWSYVAVTLDMADGNIIFYRNGTAEDTISGGVIGPMNNDSLYIGMGYDTLYSFDGLLDEVRITKRTLTAKEIASNYILTQGTYYWKVKAEDALAQVTTSSIRSFKQIPAYQPVLINPSDLALLNDNTPDFDWSSTAGPGGKYTLEYALDDAFTTGVVTVDDITDTFYTPASPLSDNDYYWHVRAYNLIEDTGDFQVVPFMFTVDTDPPDIPDLIVPADASFTNDNTPQFIWSNTVLPGETYDLQYAQDASFTTGLVTVTGLTDTSYTPISNLANGTWYWRVQAIDEAANPSGFNSTPFSFTVYFALPEVWVDDDYTDVGANDGHTWGYDAFALIQDGVDAVETGGTVNILPGTYEEQVVIDKDDLSLLGSGNGSDPGTSSVIVSPTSLTYYFVVGSNNNFPIVGIHDATGVTIDNVRIDGSGRGSGNYRFTGIGFWNAGGDVTDNYVTGLRESPYNGSQHGVGIYSFNDTGGPYTINVSGTTVEDFQKNGITLLGDGLSVNVDACTVTGQGSTNLIAQNGIQIGYGAGGTITDCDVSEISYSPATWLACGVLLLNGTSVDMTDANTVDNCMVGVMYQETSGMVDGLVVNSGTDDFCAGISLRDDGAMVKSGNNLYLPPVASFETDLTYRKLPDKALGTIVDVNDVELVGTHSLYGYGISAWGYGDNIVLTLTNSTVRDWEIGLVAYESGGTVSLPTSHTKIYDNDDGYYAGTALEQNAENNWWGSLLGPYHPATNPYGDGDEVTDNVDYEPWCNEDFTVCNYTAEPSEVWVDDDYTDVGTNDGHVWGYDAFDAVQDGITALADQGLVHVMPGTYIEQLRIDGKSLDLLGAGIGQSIIQAVPVGDRATYSITQWEGSARTIDACIGVTDAAEVNITGFTVDGLNLGPNNFYGVHYYNTSGSVNDCRVQHITDAAAPSNSRVVSLVATHGEGETADVSFIKVEVPDFQKGGIVTMGPGLTCTLEDNDIDGAVNPNLAPNGIQVSYGSSGTLTDNSVTSVEYPGSDWAGTGILLMESGSVSVTGGEVIGCEVGVGFSQWNWIYTQTSTPTIVIDGVTFTSNQWAVETHLADDGVNLDLEVTNCQITSSTYVGVELWGSDVDPWGGSYYSGWTNGTLNADIHDNYITNGDVGVEEYIELATGNTVNGSVTGNSLSGNTGYGVYNNFTNLLDATSNWWGDASGPDDGSKSATGEVLKRTAVPYEVSDMAVPLEYSSRRDSYAEKGSGAAVTANVDYSPWWGADYVGDPHSTTWNFYVNTSNSSTIQEGVDLAVTGDIIHAGAGTYHNDIHFLEKNVTLLGAQADVDPAGSTGRGSESILTRDDEYALWVQPSAAGAVINGFKFGDATVNSGRRIYVNDGPGVIVEYNIFVNTTGHGVAISGASDGTEVKYNTFDNTALEGIINSGSADIQITYNTVQNVDNFAIKTDGKAVISDNTVTQCKYGIHAGYNGTSALDRVEVINNDISYTNYTGISISGAYTYIYNNTLHNCNYYGSGSIVPGDWDYASVHLDPTAVNCTVEGNTIYDGINGIQTWANNAIITNNDIYDMGSTYADEKVDGSRTYLNSGILIGSNWGTGDHDPSGVVIYHNKLHGNYHGLFYSADLSHGVTAEFNYWGDDSGPYNFNYNSGGLGNPVSDNVDFSPWCNIDFTVCDFAIGCCVGYTGNADCSGDEEPDIADITTLIDHLYLSHKSLCCLEEADVDASGKPGLEPDIADITRLIDYLYNSHAPLATCP